MFSKPHSRSKSRSPTPGWHGIGSPQTPTFQPPSYYAAAAGLPVTQQSNGHSSTSGTSGKQYSSPALLLPSDTGDRQPVDYTRGISSEGLDEGHAVLPSQFNRLGHMVARSPNISGPSPSSAYSAGRTSQGKEAIDQRKSQYYDIPHMETLLIPSLKDTIDKMTHPPQLTNASAQEHHEPATSVPLRSPSTPSQARPGPAYLPAELLSPVPPVPRAGSRLATSPATPSRLASPRIKISSATSEPRPARQENSRVNPDHSHAEAQEDTPQSTRSPLTRRMQAPTPVISADIPPQPHKSSLRTAKAMPPRSPGPSRITEPDITGPSQTPSTPSGSRPRSRSGQTKVQDKPRSQLPVFKSKSRSNPNTPQETKKVARFATPPTTHISTVPSSFPRCGLPKPNYSSNSTSESGSDLEQRLAPILGRSRLEAVKAAVIANSSDSENDADTWRRPQTPSRIPAAAKRKSIIAPRGKGQLEAGSVPRLGNSSFDIGPSRRQSVGLGLGIGTHMERQQSHVAALPDEDASVYEENINSSTFNVADSADKAFTDDDGSVYEDDQHCGQADQVDYDVSRQRREALRGLVDGLDVDYRNTMAARMSMQSEQGDHSYAQGFAVSVSDEDFANMHRDDAHPDQSEDIAFHRPRSRPDSRLSEHGNRSSMSRQSSYEQYEQPIGHPGVTSEVSRSSSHRRKESRRSVAVNEKSTTNTNSERPERAPAAPPPMPSRRSQQQHRSPRPPGIGTADPKRQTSNGDSLRVRDPYYDSGRGNSERERDAFGIPVSLSYGANDSSPEPSSPHERDSSLLTGSRHSGASYVSSELPSRAASRLSSVSVERTRSKDGLSKGAAALFEKLADDDPQYSDLSDEEGITPRVGYPPGDGDLQRYGETAPSASSSSFTESSSAPSVYEHEQVEDHDPPPSASEDSPGSWRMMLQPATYDALQSSYGPTEMSRQEVIHTLLVSEHAFVKHMRTALPAFILPLRRRDSRAWLPGVPARIAQLFDWLEDILNWHNALYRALKNVSGPWRAGAIVERVAEGLRECVLGLEVYQPYLMRVDEVREEIEYAKRGDGPFGEYLRMCERKEDACGVDELLQTPLNRLLVYPDTFQRLFGATPKDHPDHLAALSLSALTNTMLQVLDEVRVREEEYDFVKRIISRLHGLPAADLIPRRERRLLFQGPVNRAHPHHKPLPVQVKRTPSVTGTRSRAGSRAGAGSQNTQRSSRLVSAIHDWHVRKTHSGSISSFESSASSTANTAWSITSQVTNATSVQSFANAAAQAHAFVFSDVLLLVTGEGHDVEVGNSDCALCLLPKVGLSRVLNCSAGRDAAGQTVLVTLDLIPTDVEELDSCVVRSSANPVELRLAIPATQEHASLVAAAFAQSSKHTAHLLAYPPMPQLSAAYGADVELELDTRETVLSILSAGLPLPKSPSVQQMASAQRKNDEGAGEEEREERGWWALRFQQVLREVQRRDRALLVRDAGITAANDREA